MRWLKLQVHVQHRNLCDLFSNNKFCKPRPGASYSNYITVVQPFTPSATLESKKTNLRIASSRIRRYIIYPGEVFSFWRCVGNPNTKEFACSRGIRSGVLQIERGGGLCQASGIIHHLSLIGGLEIIERYNHSKDLYTEETRFCPLGSDATVAYGYRDLRVKNITDSKLYFELTIGEKEFTGRLYSERLIKNHDIGFEYEELPGNILKAKTIDKESGKILYTSIYEKMC